MIVKISEKSPRNTTESERQFKTASKKKKIELKIKTYKDSFGNEMKYFSDEGSSTPVKYQLLTTTPKPMPKPFNPPQDSSQVKIRRGLPNPRNIQNSVTNNIMGDSDYSEAEGILSSDAEEVMVDGNSENFSS